MTAVPREEVGTRLTAHLVDRWEHDDTLMALLRAAVTNPAAADRMRELFAAQIGPAVAALVEDRTETALRAGLVATQALGFALTRYVLRLPPVVALTRTEVVAWLGPTMQRYLTDERA
ncbi:hypothetical protein ACFQV2_19555 [Actinokineospora soli]|uniref:Tetracyclin repressor-like C-terminal domain-containing protein n=1 Tax=Actinokineospora soli TaxID=1048753 RepID=A0ABW2TQ48_9PSEU